ncbi:MAG: ABC transporter permease [Hyphomicrobiales bacterium]|jgi:peptide/nickel transport system permease protein|nr:ABC transporter permease [Hyphomicrobiales bacterium]
MSLAANLRTRLARAPASIIIMASLLGAFVLMALFAPLLAPFDPARQSLIQRLRPPGHTTAQGLTYLMGTDDLGRDLLSRVIHGARASMLVAVASVSVSLLIGSALGMLAGWRRGWIEVAIMRFVDIMLSIPAILLAVLAVAVVGPGFQTLILVLGLTRWPRYARVAYAQTLQVATLPYMRAAELAGAGGPRLLLRHILPNIAGPLLVVATAEFGLMILFEASLSFLGLGIQPPTPSWGTILSAGRQYLERAWWLTAFPGACLFLLVLSVNVLGDWLRDHLDPRSRPRG